MTALRGVALGEAGSGGYAVGTYVRTAGCG